MIWNEEYEKKDGDSNHDDKRQSHAKMVTRCWDLEQSVSRY
jgi:hypothetical protein